MSDAERKRWLVDNVHKRSQEAKLITLAGLLAGNEYLPSSENKRGYQLWTYAVVSKLKKTNAYFDQEFHELFKCMHFDQVFIEDINTELEKYYALLEKRSQ